MKDVILFGLSYTFMVLPFMLYLGSIKHNQKKQHKEVLVMLSSLRKNYKQLSTIVSKIQPKEIIVEKEIVKEVVVEKEINVEPLITAPTSTKPELFIPPIKELPTTPKEPVKDYISIRTGKMKFKVPKNVLTDEILERIPKPYSWSISRGGFAVYWVYPDDIKAADPYRDGYIGSTSDIHVCIRKLKDKIERGAHKNAGLRSLQYKKYHIMVIASELTEEQASALKHHYRPDWDIGFNVEPGGR